LSWIYFRYKLIILLYVWTGGDFSKFVVAPSFCEALMCSFCQNHGDLRWFCQCHRQSKHALGTIIVFSICCAIFGVFNCHDFDGYIILFNSLRWVSLRMGSWHLNFLRGYIWI